MQRVRQGELRPDQPHHDLASRCCATPTDVGRHAAGLQRRRAQHDLEQHLAANENQKTRGFEIPQISYTGTLDITLSNSSLLSVRGGIFDDNYRDTGVPLTSSVSYQTSNIERRAARLPDPGQPAGRRRVPEHPARAAVARVRSHQARLRPGGLHPGVQRRRAPQPQGRLRRAAHDQRRRQHLPRRRLRRSSGGIARSRARPPGLTDRGPYGYYEVNDFGTRGEASADILSLYVQDQWTINNLTLNLGLRTEREVIPSFRPDIKAEGVQVQLRRQAGAAPRRQLRRARRWPVQGLRQLGPLLRLDQVRAVRAAGSAATSGACTTARSTRTDVFSLSGTNMPGRNLWTPEAGQLPRSAACRTSTRSTRTSSR